MMDLKPYLSHSFVSSSEQLESICHSEPNSAYYNHYNRSSHYNPGCYMTQSSWPSDYPHPYVAHPTVSDYEEYRSFYPPSSISPDSSGSFGQPYVDSASQAVVQASTCALYEGPDQQTSYQDLRRITPPSLQSARYPDTAANGCSISSSAPDAATMSKKRTGVPGTGRKERRRTISLNSAFSTLRSRIPKVPVDTKLSKIKTLRLATLYIQYLNKILRGPIDGPQMQPSDFEVDLHQFKRNRSSIRCAAAIATTSPSDVTAGSGATSSQALPSPSTSSTSCSTTASPESTERMTHEKGSCRKVVNGTMLDRMPGNGLLLQHHDDHYRNHRHQVGKGRTGWSEAVWKEQVRTGASTSLQQHPSFLPSSSHVSIHQHSHPLQHLVQHHPEHLQDTQLTSPAFIN